MHEVILDQRLTEFVINIRLRVVCGLCARFRARHSKEVLKRPKWADTGEMRPEGVFQRTLEHIQEVISGRNLNPFVICVRLRVVCVLGVPAWARATLKTGLETAEMG